MVDRGSEASELTSYFGTKVYVRIGDNPNCDLVPILDLSLLLEARDIDASDIEAVEAGFLNLDANGSVSCDDYIDAMRAYYGLTAQKLHGVEESSFNILQSIVRDLKI